MRTITASNRQRYLADNGTLDGSKYQPSIPARLRESQSIADEPGVEPLLSIRNEIQLDFSGSRVIGGNIFPLFHCQCGSIHQNRIAADR